MAEISGKIDMLEPKGTIGSPKEPDAATVSADEIKGVTVNQVITIFANALGNLLRLKGDNKNEENEGIVVEIDDHKYIVFVAQDMAVHIADASPDHDPGQKVWVHFGNPEDYDLSEDEKDSSIEVK